MCIPFTSPPPFGRWKKDPQPEILPLPPAPDNPTPSQPLEASGCCPFIVASGWLPIVLGLKSTVTMVCTWSDGQAANRKCTAHTHHRTRVRAQVPVGLPWSRRFLQFWDACLTDPMGGVGL